MNKQFLRFTALVILSVFVISSCKKNHSLHSYPDNIRLLSFAKTTSYSNNTTVINENYRFLYDVYNRVSQIIHTKNDGSSNKICYLTYKNDTIYDTTRYVNQSAVLEVDTFVVDSRGFITYTYMLGNVTSYSYLGNLLTHISSNSTSYTYNSYNGNFTTAIPGNATTVPLYYTFYTDQFNRTGDYLQLNSCLTYGFNFYQNNNLVRSIGYVYDTTKLTYVIDADNKITQTTAITTDTGYRKTTEVYDIQYETYK